MKKNTKRLLVTVMLLLSLTANALALEEITYPLTEQTVEFTIAVAKGAGFLYDFPEMQFINEQSERTNVRINWIEISEDTYNEKAKIMLASGMDLPDAFMGATGFPTAAILNFAEDGTIIPLNDLIDNYTVNMKRQLDQNPDFRKLMTSTDGNIYSLWTCEAVPNRLCVNRCLNINQEWLANVGLSMPTTFEEFNAMLYAFKEKDGNGNGIIGDETVLTGSMYTSANQLSDEFGLHSLSGFFNIADSNSHVMIVDDQCLYTPIQDRFRDYVTWLHQLYVDGILDPEVFTQNSTQYIAKAKTENSIGVGFASNVVTLSGKANPPVDTQFRAMEPIVGYYGEMMNTVSPFLVPSCVPNAFFITYECEQPKLLLQYFDYWFDGGSNALSWRFGQENECWRYLPEEGEGVWEIMEVDDSNNYYSKYCPSYMGLYWILMDQASMRNNPGLIGEFQNMVTEKWNPPEDSDLAGSVPVHGG